MRFLFIHQRYADSARKLLRDLAVDDVTIVLATQANPNAPTESELRMLEAHKGASAAGCEINRRYRKIVGDLVDFCCEPKKFRIDDQQLKEWLVPRSRIAVTYGKPSVAFISANEVSPRLILHPEALKSADDLVEVRWEFATRSANLLARYARDESLGALRDWDNNHGVPFATNGPVAYKYHVICGGQVLNGTTEWHLKSGDHTKNRDNVARIYFARLVFRAGPRVIVFFVGPHPQDGTREVTITIDRD